MRTLTAAQDELRVRCATAPVWLVELVTYADYGAKTPEATFYWTLAGAAVRYPWSGADRSFDPILATLGPIVRAIDHIPNAESVDIRRSVLDLVVGNVDVGDGSTLWETLRGLNLPYARITVASVLVDPVRRAGAGSLSACDLTDYAGDEHLVRFRGELTQVGEVTGQGIPLTFETVEPDLDWPRETDASTADPKDLGKRYPIVVGRAKGIACVNSQVGWHSTLASALTSSQTGNVAVSDATGLPDSGSFSLQVGGERVTATKVDSQTINLSARGQDGSTATSHPIGESFFEILAELVLVANGVESEDVDELYVVSPLTRDLTRVNASRYSIDAADAAHRAGRVLTTVRISASQARALYDDLVAVAGGDEVTQQPNQPVTTQPVHSLDDSAPETVQVFFTSVEQRDSNNALRASITHPAPDRSSWEFASELSQQCGTVSTTRTDGASFWIGAAPSGGRAVKRWRAVCFFATVGDSSAVFDAVVSCRFFGQVDTASATVAQGSALAEGVVAKTAWQSPSSKTVSDCERSSAPTADGNDNYLSFYLDVTSGTPAGGNARAVLRGSDSYLEIELEPLPVVRDTDAVTTRTADVQISGGEAVAFFTGVEFVADVSGALRGATYEALFGFESASGWGGNVAADAAVLVEGSASLRFDVGESALAVTVWTEADQASEWTALDGGSVADDTGISTDGSSVRVDNDGAGGPARAEVSGLTRDLSGDQRLLLHLRIDTADLVRDVQVLLEDGSANTFAWLFGTAEFAEGTWALVILDLAEASAGGLDESDVVRLEVRGRAQSETITDVSTLDDLETFGGDTDGWQANTNDFDLTLDSTIHKDGESVHAEKLRHSFNSGIIGYPGTYPSGSVDWTGYTALRFWFRWTATPTSYPDEFLIELYDGSNVSDLLLDVADYPPDIWHEIDHPIVASGFDESQVEIVIVKGNPGGYTEAGLEFWVDDFRLVNTQDEDSTLYVDEVRSLDASTAAEAALENGIAGEDWTSDDDLYRVSVRTSRAGTSVAVWWSDAVSGTPPANRLELARAPAAVDTWELEADVATTIGSPDASSVHSIGVRASLGAGSFVEPWVAGGLAWSAWADRLQYAPPGATGWQAAIGELVEHPADVLRWWVETFGDGALGDASSFAQTITDLPSYVLAGDLRTVGEASFGAVLQSLAYHARASVFLRETDSATVYVLAQASASYAFPSPARALTELRNPKEARKLATELATSIAAAYDLRPWRGLGIEAYLALLQVGPDQNDIPALASAIAAAALARGKRVADLVSLPLIQDTVTAKGVLGYYANEALRTAARPGASIPWADGYDLEVADIVSLALPWSSTSLKVRVVQVTLDPMEAAIGVNLEEVL